MKISALLLPVLFVGCAGQRSDLSSQKTLGEEPVAPQDTKVVVEKNLKLTGYLSAGAYNLSELFDNIGAAKADSSSIKWVTLKKDGKAVSVKIPHSHTMFKTSPLIKAEISYNQTKMQDTSGKTIKTQTELVDVKFDHSALILAKDWNALIKAEGDSNPTEGSFLNIIYSLTQPESNLIKLDLVKVGGTTYNIFLENHPKQDKPIGAVDIINHSKDSEAQKQKSSGAFFEVKFHHLCGLYVSVRDINTTAKYMKQAQLSDNLCNIDPIVEQECDGCASEPKEEDFTFVLLGINAITRK